MNSAHSAASAVRKGLFAVESETDTRRATAVYPSSLRADGYGPSRRAGVLETKRTTATTGRSNHRANVRRHSLPAIHCVAAGLHR